MSRAYTITNRGAIMFSALWKLLTMFAPFIKEMILGDSNIEETIRRNKMIAFLMGVLVVVFIIDLYTYKELASLRLEDNNTAQNNAVLTANAAANQQYINTLTADLVLERQRVSCTNTPPVAPPVPVPLTPEQLKEQNDDLKAQIQALQQGKAVPIKLIPSVIKGKGQ